mgnify:CR=1 FL=1|tara:strand:- start:13770 stop:14069 length:300 start_codon:yes stop_codon:yes gene_type:complete
MRAVHLSDLNLAARALLAVPDNGRRELLKYLIQYAHLADKFRKKTGRAHPQFGDGSLGAICQPAAMAAMPDRCDPRYLECLGIVIEGLLDRATIKNLEH